MSAAGALGSARPARVARASHVASLSKPGDGFTGRASGLRRRASRVQVSRQVEAPVCLSNQSPLALQLTAGLAGSSSKAASRLPAKRRTLARAALDSDMFTNVEGEGAVSLAESAVFFLLSLIMNSEDPIKEVWESRSQRTYTDPESEVLFFGPDDLVPDYSAFVAAFQQRLPKLLQIESFTFPYTPQLWTEWEWPCGDGCTVPAEEWVVWVDIAFEDGTSNVYTFRMMIVKPQEGEDGSVVHPRDWWRTRCIMETHLPEGSGEWRWLQQLRKTGDTTPQVLWPEILPSADEESQEEGADAFEEEEWEAEEEAAAAAGREGAEALAGNAVALPDTEVLGRVLKIGKRVERVANERLDDGEEIDWESIIAEAEQLYSPEEDEEEEAEARSETPEDQMYFTIEAAPENVDIPDELQHELTGGGKGQITADAASYTVWPSDVKGAPDMERERKIIAAMSEEEREHYDLWVKHMHDIRARLNELRDQGKWSDEDEWKLHEELAGELNEGMADAKAKLSILADAIGAPRQWEGFDDPQMRDKDRLSALPLDSYMTGDTDRLILGKIQGMCNEWVREHRPDLLEQVPRQEGGEDELAAGVDLGPALRKLEDLEAARAGGEPAGEEEAALAALLRDFAADQERSKAAGEAPLQAAQAAAEEGVSEQSALDVLRAKVAAEGYVLDGEPVKENPELDAIFEATLDGMDYEALEADEDTPWDELLLSDLDDELARLEHDLDDQEWYSNLERDEAEALSELSEKDWADYFDLIQKLERAYMQGELPLDLVPAYEKFREANRQVEKDMVRLKMMETGEKMEPTPFEKFKDEVEAAGMMDELLEYKGEPMPNYDPDVDPAVKWEQALHEYFLDEFDATNYNVSDDPWAAERPGYADHISEEEKTRTYNQMAIDALRPETAETHGGWIFADASDREMREAEAQERRREELQQELEQEERDIRAVAEREYYEESDDFDADDQGLAADDWLDADEDEVHEVYGDADDDEDEEEEYYDTEEDGGDGEEYDEDDDADDDGEEYYEDDDADDDGEEYYEDDDADDDGEEYAEDGGEDYDDDDDGEEYYQDDDDEEFSHYEGDED